MWTMSSGRSSQISFTTYCSNIMGTFVFIIGIASIAYAANIMENMITKEKRIAFLMLPATMIEKFVARFLIVTVGMAAAIIVAASLEKILLALFLHQPQLIWKKLWLFKVVDHVKPADIISGVAVAATNSTADHQIHVLNTVFNINSHR